MRYTFRVGGILGSKRPSRSGKDVTAVSSSIRPAEQGNSSQLAADSLARPHGQIIGWVSTGAFNPGTAEFGPKLPTEMINILSLVLVFCLALLLNQDHDFDRRVSLCTEAWFGATIPG